MAKNAISWITGVILSQLDLLNSLDGILVRRIANSISLEDILMYM